LALQEVMNGPAGVSLALGLARVMPPRQGHWLAKRLGGRLGQIRKSRQVRAVTANHRVISEGKLSELELQKNTQATFEATARCIYDFYHNYDDPDSIRKLVEIDHTLITLIEKQRKSQIGLLIASLHFSNFDLELRAAVLAGLELQVLGYPQPHYGYRLQNRIRKIEGMEITPYSFTALQKAIKRLKSGGIVITGVDRPTPKLRYKPLFFGRQSALPVSHVQLALKADVPVVVVSGRTLPDGHYCAQASDPIQMQRFKDPTEEVLWNTEQILKAIEPMIRWDPKQWSMFYPVWPDTMSQN
jgi:lauroyl/myristoyl acyltransferase